MQIAAFRLAISFILAAASMAVFESQAATTTVEMRNTFFSPATVTIDVGDTVTWIQKGSNHDTVSTTGVWASDILNFNETFSFTFNNSGTFNYFCTPHRNRGMTGTVNVRAANTPPTVTLVEPTANATFSTTDTITFSATASDAGGTVSKVEFFANDTLVGTDTTNPYSVTASLPAGNYAVTAKATDNANTSTTTPAVNIVVNAVNTPPVVTLTADPSGRPLQAPATVVLAATATDADGIQRVEFFNGATSLFIDGRSPYQFTVADLAPGIHSFTAQAVDPSGLSTTSSAIEIRVAAVPRIDSIQRTANTVTIVALGTTGIPHTLEGSDTFIGWTDVSTQTPVDGKATFTDSASLPKRFYRIAVK